jgi:hypothetical protein
VAAVPSAPRDVEAVASSPVTANVTWRMPERINGRPADVRYQIDWHTFNSDGTKLHGTLGGGGGTGAGAGAEQPRPSNIAQEMYMMVPNLHAAQRYYFRVSTAAVIGEGTILEKYYSGEGTVFSGGGEAG